MDIIDTTIMDVILKDVDITTTEIIFNGDMRAKENFDSLSSKAAMIGITPKQILGIPVLYTTGAVHIISNHVKFKDGTLSTIPLPVGIKIKAVRFINNVKIDAMYRLFSNLSIGDLDLRGLDMSDVSSMAETFTCTKVEKLHLENLDTRNLERIVYAFEQITVADGVIDLSSWNLDNLKEATGAFYTWENQKKVLKLIDFGRNTLPKLETAKRMFKGAKVVDLKLPNATFGKLVQAKEMFQNIEVNRLDLSGVTSEAWIAEKDTFTNANIKNLEAPEFLKEYINKKHKHR